jgi:hypothetical protein
MFLTYKTAFFFWGSAVLAFVVLIIMDLGLISCQPEFKNEDVLPWLYFGIGGSIVSLLMIMYATRLNKQDRIKKANNEQ